MVLIAGVQANYVLRWAFSYWGEKKSVHGEWGFAGQGKQKAEFTDKDNLAFVSIEAMDIETNIISVKAMALADEYVNFQWMGKVIVQAMDNTNKPQKFTPALVGAKIITRHYIYTVLITGETETRVRTKEEKKIIFHTTGV